jgi:hypothetical protein
MLRSIGLKGRPCFLRRDNPDRLSLGCCPVARGGVDSITDYGGRSGRVRLAVGFIGGPTRELSDAPGREIENEEMGAALASGVVHDASPIRCEPWVLLLAWLLAWRFGTESDVAAHAQWPILYA